MRALLQAVRESCSPATWSRGVELARADAVVGVREADDEVELRVATKGGLVSPQVILYLQDQEWSCECNSTEDACAHVAAAVIALNLARKDGRSLPGAGDDAPGHLAYRLDGRSGKLALHRVVVQGGQDHVLGGSIAHIALGKIRGPKFVADDADLAFEKKLGTFSGGTIPRPAMAKILDALQGVRVLTLDGMPATATTPTSGMMVRVTQTPNGFLARLEQDPGIDEVYENGAVRRQGTVAAVGEHGLPQGEFEELRKGKTYEPKAVGTLVGDVLPRLRRHVNVVVEATELPGARSIKPQLAVATERAGDDLAILPTLVYGDPPHARVDGERLTMLRHGDVPLRNTRLEKQLISRLSGLGLACGTRVTLPAEAAIALLERLRSSDGLVLLGDAHRQFRSVGDLTPQLRLEDHGNFSLWFAPEDGGEQVRADAEAVVRAWERGESLAPLLEGGFGAIPAAWLAQHGDRVVALLAAREGRSDQRPAAWATADLAALCESLDQPPPPGFDRLRSLVNDFEGIGAPRLPDDLQACLRDYQLRGVAWLGFLRDADLGGLLADDMGLGKTLQTLCAIEGRALVVAPTSVLPNWAAEIAKFRPSLQTCVYHGSNRALDPEADVTLTTYALLRLDIDTLTAERWDTVVLDEAQAIKNPDSQVARAAYRLDARFRVALTGTPVENRLEDLWSQLHFTNPGLLGGRSHFTERFARPILGGDESTARTLRQRIKPFVLRRLKRDVAAELPARTEVVLHCELSADERRVYDAVRAATQQSIAEKLGRGADVMAMLEALLRLRQAACHPALVPGQAELASRASAKLALLVETLDEIVAEGHKALVFSQWTSLLDLVEPHLRTAKLAFVRLDGSTRDRKSVVETFGADDGPPVMLISLRAGGTGLNLTAADHVFLLDPWWNPAVEDQAADRAHRIGQDKPVFVHRLVARETVEERILALQARKRQLAEAAIGEARAAAQITRDELIALLA